MFETMSNIRTISILGCGWYGFALAQNLVKDYVVKGSSTTTTKLSQLEQAGIQPYLVKFEADTETYDSDFFKCDLLIISIPPKRRSGEAALYPNKIQRIKTAIQTNNVPRVLFISSTAVYGDHNTQVDEDTLPHPDTESGRAIFVAENYLKDQTDFKVTILRFGGLIGPGRDPARFFAGKKNIPNGNAPVNMVHLNDCIGITDSIIQKDAFGYTFNICSANHPTKVEFYKQAALNSNMEPPEFIEELTSWKIVTSKYVKEVLTYNTNLI